MDTPIDLSLFPLSSTILSNGRLAVDGQDLAGLAQTYGTPYYLYDGATVRYQVQRLQRLFSQHYAGPALVAYAVKAYFSRGIAQKMAGLGIGADVVSLGEINIARQVGFQPQTIHLHGNNKSAAELQAALDWDIQAIVVDSLDELEFLEGLAAQAGKRPRIWLRITPDLDVNTHPHIETASVDSKFGLHLMNGQAAQGIRRAMASPHLHLVGLHTHLGSQLFSPEPYVQATRILYQLACAEGFVPEEFSPGGGWGVRYTEQNPSDDPGPWIEAISREVGEQCSRLKWPLPKIVVEPGRSLVARAGVAVYSIGAQKETANGERIVAVDGGMADNPRYALYQASYTARVVGAPAAPLSQKARLVGKFCESGDVLIPEVALPEVRRGDVIAMPAAGAYQLSMSSNYNFATRPPVLWLDEGKIEVMQKRESPSDPCWWTNC